jgi:hypothetical protein
VQSENFLPLPPIANTGPIIALANFKNSCPQINVATSKEFELVNPCKESNFIMGSVLNSELIFVVENIPKTTPTTGCPGWWMFALMMDHFQIIGTAISAVVGSWTYGDNLAAINRLTGGFNPLSLEEAAKRTKTGEYAASRQFTRVSVVSSTGTPGNYTQVRVLFEMK